MAAQPAANRWGTVSGGLRSPPPAPSSGAGVRRNHTIHGARHHGKPRLEKHFEQPEDYPASPSVDPTAAQAAAAPRTDDNADAARSLDASVDLLSSPSRSTDTSAGFASSLTPLQALYSKSSVSRNLSLPSRHSSKLAANLPHSATQGRTSAFNSLSAITGGSDLDEHDWEKMIHSSNALGDEHHQDPNASHTDLPWSSSLFSQAQSSHPASPTARSELFLDTHSHNGSTATADLYDPASATADPAAARASTGFVRRHQSLNHHSGRTAAHRLATRSSGLNSRFAGDAADVLGHSDPVFSPARPTASLSAASSPVIPSSFSKAPWNQPPQDPIGSPSRFAASFPAHNLDGTHSRMQSGLDAPSPSSLLEIGDTLSNLDLTGSSPARAGEDLFDIPPSNAASASHLAHGHAMQPSLSAYSNDADARPASAKRLPQLVTNRDALQGAHRAAPNNSLPPGPMSASAFVPPIGHAHSRNQSNDPNGSHAPLFDPVSSRLGPFTAAPTGTWLDKDAIAGRSDAGPGAGPMPDSQPWPMQASAAPFASMGMDPNVMALSMALAQEQQRNAILQAQLGARHAAPGMHEPHLFGMQPIDLNANMQSIGQQLRGGPLPGSPPVGNTTNLPARGGAFQMQPPPPPHAQYRSPPLAHAALGRGGAPHAPAQDGEAEAPTPVDPTSLAIEKGYNPAPGTFDLAPANARFFVIKSYTEEDVHKSLKYEIWASTDKGNQRLDKAFRESASNGPIYLFYSVNASGHFCGMAQMLTPLDYATSSNVWAQDGKWKGTFKVRWIYVKDLPNNQLRHIRLTNTPECKPVTQSRDTQELTPEAGREVLRIMADYTHKTSLLQDFNFYEMQGRAGTQPRPAMSSPAIGLAGLPPRNSPKPGASPALAFGLPFPTSPDAGYAARSAVSPNAASRRAQGQATPQRIQTVSGLGLAPGTPRKPNPIPDTDPKLDAASQVDAQKSAIDAAHSAGLAPSAL